MCEHDIYIYNIYTRKTGNRAHFPKCLQIYRKTNPSAHIFTFFLSVFHSYNVNLLSNSQNLMIEPIYYFSNEYRTTEQDFMQSLMQSYCSFLTL